MLRRFLLCVLYSGLISGCVTGTFERPTVSVSVQKFAFDLPDHSLGAWWGFFEDPVYNRVIAAALQLNTDQQPLDIVSKLTDSYTHFRYVQNQNAILGEYMEKRRQAIETLGLSPKKDGKDTRLQNYQSQTVALSNQQSSFESQESELKQKITAITKLLPEFVDEILKERRDLPDEGIVPLLASEANVLEHAPEIISARNQYSVKEEIFPGMAINAFFGIGDQVFTGAGQPWRLKIGEAARNTKETQNTEFQTRVQRYLKELESDLISYAHLHEQTQILRKSLVSKKQEYEEQKKASLGFIKLLDLENDLYQERLSTLRAEHTTFRALAKIYLKIGVY